MKSKVKDNIIIKCIIAFILVVVFIFCVAITSMFIDTNLHWVSIITGVIAIIIFGFGAIWAMFKVGMMLAGFWN